MSPPTKTPPTPTPTQIALPLVKELEGCRLTAYQDIGGIWTIGYGHTGGVRPGDVITPAQATRILEADLGIAAGAVARLVQGKLNTNQKAALISLVFNIGTPNFTKSEMLKFLNNQKYKEAADQFLVWDHVRMQGRMVESPSLKSRRERERDLFLKPMEAS